MRRLTEERNVFQALRGYLVSRGFSLRRIFWITGALAFLISPIADNLTTALLMGAVVIAVGGGNNYSQKTIGHLYDHHYQKLAGIPNAYEAALFSPNLRGGGKWLSAAAAPLQDQNGDIQGVIELLEDHSESTGAAMHFDLMKRIARAEWDTLLFFYGVILWAAVWPNSAISV